MSGLNKYLTYTRTPGKYYTGTSILAFALGVASVGSDFETRNAKSLQVVKILGPDDVGVIREASLFLL